MKTQKEVLNFLESKLGTKVKCIGNPSLDGQCVTLIKSLMDFLGVKDPYKARGHAKTAISAYLNEGIADPGLGFLSVFSNKNMAGSYGHIWINAGEGDGTFYESNGQKALTVTKGATYPSDTVCNFDRYISKSTESNMSELKYTEEEMTSMRNQRDSNWTRSEQYKASYEKTLKELGVAVKAQARWEEVLKLGYPSAASIKQEHDSLIANLKELKESVKIQTERAELNRKEFNELLAASAKSLDTVQEKQQVMAKLGELSTTLNLYSDIKLSYATLQLDSEEKIEELNEEIARLNLMLKHELPLDQHTFEELISAIIKKLKAIIKK